MMSLKEKLTGFGCSGEFVEIALGYAQHYQADSDIEAFIEFVEEEHAKVEEAEALKEREGQIYDASAILSEFADTEESQG